MNCWQHTGLLDPLNSWQQWANQWWPCMVPYCNIQEWKYPYACWQLLITYWRECTNVLTSVTLTLYQLSWCGSYTVPSSIPPPLFVSVRLSLPLLPPSHSCVLAVIRQRPVLCRWLDAYCKRVEAKFREEMKTGLRSWLEVWFGLLLLVLCLW